MKGEHVLFSSKKDDWETPQELFDKLSRLYGPFEVDVCASPDNAKCATFFTVDDDGLAQPWASQYRSAWMNPPYGRTIGRWMEKAFQESLLGCTVVCLVPARTDTAWWHDWALRGEFAFLRGRVKFSGGISSAPFPSAVVIFRGATP